MNEPHGPRVLSLFLLRVAGPAFPLILRCRWSSFVLKSHITPASGPMDDIPITIDNGNEIPESIALALLSDANLYMATLHASIQNSRQMLVQLTGLKKRLPGCSEILRQVVYVSIHLTHRNLCVIHNSACRYLSLFCLPHTTSLHSIILICIPVRF